MHQPLPSMGVVPAKSPLPLGERRAHPRAMVLNSWKEIADYLNCGVRTVQRWERDLDLPVYRPRPGKRGPVCAFASEIQIWMHRKKTEHPSAARAVPNGSAINTAHRLVHLSTELVRKAAATTRIQQEQTIRLLETVEKLKRRIERRSPAGGRVT